MVGVAESEVDFGMTYKIRMETVSIDGIPSIFFCSNPAEMSNVLNDLIKVVKGEILDSVVCNTR